MWVGEWPKGHIRNTLHFRWEFSHSYLFMEEIHRSSILETANLRDTKGKPSMQAALQNSRIVQFFRSFVKIWPVKWITLHKEEMHAGRLNQRGSSEEIHYRHSQKSTAQQERTSKLMKQFRATGSVADKKNGRPRSSTDLHHNTC
jgi:hypothetical protein